MKLLLNTHSTNEYSKGCEYAIVDLTTSLAKTIMGRFFVFARVQGEEPAVVSMDYYDGGATFLCGLPEGLEDTLASGDNYEEVAVSDKEIQSISERTECDRMVVLSQEVYWTCYPKNCDWQVETLPIPIGIIRKAAGLE